MIEESTRPVEQQHTERICYFFYSSIQTLFLNLIELDSYQQLCQFLPDIWPEFPGIESCNKRTSPL